MGIYSLKILVTKRNYMRYNKILNLVYPDKSEIKFNKNCYPDGQNNLVISSYSIAEIKTILENNTLPVQIKSRLNNWLDLELITCAVASLRELGVEEIHLYTPYIMGARSDRKFEEGGNNYLRDVICPVINSLNFKTVTCIDPHSDVLEACIKGFRKESNLDLVKWVFMNHPQNTKPVEDFILVSPDAGASKKIYKLAEQIGYKGDIITCSKDRDENGKLTKCIVPLYNSRTQPIHKDIIIIDDICDGGATFINIAKEIKTYNVRGKIYLIVTHSIFSKGFEELSKYFDGIYCTNSYQDLNPNDLSNLGNMHLGDFVKQLNVFL